MPTIPRPTSARAFAAVAVLAAAVLGVRALVAGPALPVALDGPVARDEVVDLTHLGSEVQLEVVVDDAGFSPAFVKVAPGAEVDVVVRNDGSVEHTFVIENDLVSFDEHVAPGDTARIPYPIPMPQDRAVRFFDHDHFHDGFQGVIYSAEGQPLVGGDDLPDPESATS